MKQAQPFIPTTLPLAMPVSRFRLHPTVQAEFLSHWWCDSAGKCANDAATVALPASAPDDARSCAGIEAQQKNATMTAFPDRTIAIINQQKQSRWRGGMARAEPQALALPVLSHRLVAR
jgi:hypothetical protein